MRVKGPPEAKIRKLIDHWDAKEYKLHGVLKEKLNQRYGWVAVHAASKAERERRQRAKLRSELFASA